MAGPMGGCPPAYVRHRCSALRCSGHRPAGPAERADFGMDFVSLVRPGARSPRLGRDVGQRIAHQYYGRTTQRRRIEYRTDTGPVRRRRARCALCYRSAAFGARMRIPRVQLNGKQEADHRPACAVPATVRRPRDALPRARAQAALDATALQPGGKAAARQAASPDTGRRKGRARRSPNARSAGDG